MSDSQENEQLLQDLLNRVEALERDTPQDQFTIGVISGDLERVMFAFMTALGATVFDTEVDLFFALRATAALRDPNKIKNNLGELEPTPIGLDLEKHGASSLTDLIEQAGELGVRITICNLSLDLMGIDKEELIDYPNMSYAGVAALVSMASESKQCWFV